MRKDFLETMPWEGKEADAPQDRKHIGFGNRASIVQNRSNVEILEVLVWVGWPLRALQRLKHAQAAIMPSDCRGQCNKLGQRKLVTAEKKPLLLKSLLEGGSLKHFPGSEAGTLGQLWDFGR